MSFTLLSSKVKFFSMTDYLSFLENEKNYSKHVSNILRTVTEEEIDIFSVLQKAQSESMG